MLAKEKISNYLSFCKIKDARVIKQIDGRKE